MHNLSFHFILLSFKFDIFFIKMKKRLGTLILKEVAVLFLRLWIVRWVFLSGLLELILRDI